MKSNNLWSQLFKAAEVGDFEKCKVILEKNHDKNSPNQFGTTPLHVAAKNGHEDILRLIMDAC